MQLDEEIKSVAAMVTFRQLYDDGKRDVYQILSRFIDAILSTRMKYCFELIWMTEKLKSEYGFIIPDNVVKTSIKKLKYIKKEKGSYIVDVNRIKEGNFIEDYKNAMNNNEKIIDELCEYVTEQRGLLFPQEREILIKDFCNFLLENSNGNNYSDLISAFILKKSEMKDDHQIRLIKEGAILYAGINFNSNVSDRSVWKDDINIYVENEILFHLAGYNGEVFEKIAKDLMSLIREMNSKGKKSVIHICYFKEVEREIDDFFLRAQRIVKGEDSLSIDNYAMTKIVEGCKTESDVVMKKSDFMNLITRYGIKKASEYDYYHEENHKYNLESIEMSREYNITEDKMRYIKHLNYISILRKGSSQIDLKKSRHIVLTETGKILQISKDICGEKLPYAINIFMLTNRLWYDLNKGFGAKDFPASFDILVKSQIVLSKLLTSTIAEKYEKAKNAYQNNEMSKDDLFQAVIMLREESKRPEDITALNAEDVLVVINEEEITKYKNEQEKLKSDLSLTKIEVKDLHLNLHNKDLEIENKDKIILKVLEEKKSELISKNETKDMADKQIVRNLKRLKKLGVFIGVMYICVIVFAFFKLSDRNMNILLGLITIIPPAIGYIILVLFNKTFNFLSIIQAIEGKYRIKVTKRIYKKFKVDIDKILQLKEDIQEYEKQIKR